MTRFNDVHELLEAVDGLVELTRTEYQQARGNEQVTQVSRIRVKSALEHLRSCLDFCAVEVHERIYGGHRKKLYFPYGESESKFLSSVDNNLPGLQRRAPSVFHLVDSIQSHRTATPWLYSICKVTAENKHRNLSTQQRVNSRQSSTSIGRYIRVDGSSQVVLKDCMFDGVPVGVGTPLVLNGTTPVADIQAQLPAGMPVMRAYEAVEFRLKGSDSDILNLLETGASGIRQFTVSLQVVLSQ